MTEKVDQNKPRCQSCGMPLSQSFGNYGSLADGSNCEDYCSICFADGKFVNPEQTLAQMIASSIENMTNEVGIPLEQATQLANDFIPTLKRWR